jgi:hypothetical protein
MMAPVRNRQIDAEARLASLVDTKDKNESKETLRKALTSYSPVRSRATVVQHGYAHVLGAHGPTRGDNPQPLGVSVLGNDPLASVDVPGCYIRPVDLRVEAGTGRFANRLCFID